MDSGPSARWDLSGPPIAADPLNKMTGVTRSFARLMEMVERLPAGTTVELPMSRRDIQDYLGLTVEPFAAA
jgi:Bacterial regulatory proteins, crp family